MKFRRAQPTLVRKKESLEIKLKTPMSLKGTFRSAAGPSEDGIDNGGGSRLGSGVQDHHSGYSPAFLSSYLTFNGHAKATLGSKDEV